MYCFSLSLSLLRLMSHSFTVCMCVCHCRSCTVWTCQTWVLRCVRLSTHSVWWHHQTCCGWHYHSNHTKWYLSHTYTRTPSVCVCVWLVFFSSDELQRDAVTANFGQYGFELAQSEDSETMVRGLEVLRNLSSLLHHNKEWGDTQQPNHPQNSSSSGNTNASSTSSETPSGALSLSLSHY